MTATRTTVDCGPLFPRTPISPVGRLTPYGKLALRKGHLPTGLGKPAAGFPQPPSLDDESTPFSLHISNCRHRTKVVDAGHAPVPTMRNPVHEPSHQNPAVERSAVVTAALPLTVVRTCGPGKLCLDPKTTPKWCGSPLPMATKTASYNRFTRPESRFLNVLPDRFAPRIPNAQD